MFCPKCGTSIGIDFLDFAKPHRYGISVSKKNTLPTSPRPFFFPESGGLGTKKEKEKKSQLN